MRRALHGAVLGTRGLPVLGALYRGLYRAAASASAGALGALPGVRGVYLHRGLTGPGWEPGVSDIDLIAVLEGGAYLARVGSRLRALRAAFPMLGDVWMGTIEEASAYLRWGGLRAWEDPPSWRLLGGRPIELPASAESSAKRRRLDPWLWAFVSYMEISRRTFLPWGGLEEKRRLELRKLYWDARRFCEAASTGEAPASRSEAAAWGEPDNPWLDAALRFARASRGVLARLATGESSGTAFPPLADGRILPVAVRAARLAVWDPPYHRYLVLAEESEPSDYLLAAEAFARGRLPGVPVALEPAGWALLLQSAYPGAPLGWLGSGEGRGSEAGAGLFPGWGARAEGHLAPSPLLPAGLRREAAAEAASWMLLWWRALWVAPGWSNRFVLYHLYTRVLGLRLALAGEAPGPFCDWELLLARLAARGGDGRALLRIRRLLLGEGSAALDSCERGALAPGHAAALAAAMDELRAAL